MNRKLFIFFVVALLLVSAAFSFSELFAYDDKTTHLALTDEIVDFYNLSRIDTPLTAEQKEWVVEGAMQEDTPPRWINHFYDPIWKNGWSGEHTGWLWERMMQSISYWMLAQYEPVSSLNWLRNRELQLSYALYGGDHTWDRAIEEYRKGNKKEAYRTLGHVLHLIEDASVPDHTRNDTHAHELRWATGDYGSPYEEYLKQYDRQTIKQLRIAETLMRERQQPPKLPIIDDYLISLAKYSNNYFFSKDTINETGDGDKFKHQYPKIIRDNNIIGYGKDEVGKEFELVSVKISIDVINRIITRSYYLPVNDRENNYEVILDAYFSRLSRQAVLHGAGVIELFNEQAKQSESKSSFNVVLPPVISITGEGYRAWNFLSSVVSAVSEAFSFFSNLLPAQLAGLISTGAQPEGRVAVQPSPEPALQPTLVPVISQPQDGTVIVAPPVVHEAPVAPVTQITDMQESVPQTPSQPTILPVEIEEIPAIVSEAITSTIENTITAPVYHGSGSVTGVSPDAPKEPEPTLMFAAADISVASTNITATSTEGTTPPTGDTAATSTDSTATSTEDVVETATSTEPIIVAPPEIIDGPSVVINEIAWMGTKAQANDEWIELYNKTSADIDLSGWTLESRNKHLSVSLSGTIAAKGYFLLERTASTTTDQAEQMVYVGALNNSGPDANIYLKNGTTTVDAVDFGYWLHGQNSEKRTMERVSPYATSINSYNWRTYSETLTLPFAEDAKGGDILGTPGAKNSVTGYYTPAGSIIEDTVWRKVHSPYYVPPYMLQVQSGATLTIEPGVVVKLAKGMPYGGGMDVRGVLRAEGTATESIIFTSFADDAADSIDSNQDGAATSPASADWMNVNFHNTITPSVISHVQVRYGGQGRNNNPNGWYPAYTGVLGVYGAYPQIVDSFFERNHAISVYVADGAHPMLMRNTIQNTVVPAHAGARPGGFGVRIADASSTADIIGNIFEDNIIGISSESATNTPLIIKDNIFTHNQKNGEFNYAYGDFNLENTNNQDSERTGGFYIQLVVRDGQAKTLHADTMPYILRGGITVEEGGIFAIEPGAVIKSAANPQAPPVPVVVRGTLKAQGSAERPIIFTAFEDSSDGYASGNGGTVLLPGVWKNIQFIGATSSDSVLEYVNIRYGGSGENLCPYAYLGGPCMEYKGAVLIQDASPTISHTTFDKNLAISVYIEGDAHPTIEYSDIRNTKQAVKNPMATIGGIGISIGAESTPVLTDNTFTDNLEDVVYRP